MRNVALIIETSSSYGRGLLKGIARYNFEKGDWVIHFRPYGLSESVPRWFQLWHGDGILARIDNPLVAEAVLSHGVPVIDLRNKLDLNIPPFGTSNSAVSAMAFEHFRDCGLRNFAFYGEPSGTYRYDDDRRMGFQNRVTQAGCDCHIFCYEEDSPEATDGDLRQDRLSEWILSLPKPIGILCCHDEQGQELVDVCRICDVKVPGQVAVLGVDNDPFICGLSIPTLSSIDLNTDRIGYEAAATLDKMMSIPDYSFSGELIPPRIVITRKSTDLLASDDPEIVQAVRFIRKNACLGISVDDVIHAIPMSRSTLNRRFKALFDQSPKAVIIRTQLDLARRALIETDLAISVVSCRCGFSDAKYFHEVFLRRVGVTPHQFRMTHSLVNNAAARDILQE